jgi:diacylglycerol O-acyltransferase-1
MPALLITSYLFINVLKLISYYQVNSEIYFIADKIKRTSTNENYRNMFAEHEIDTPNLELIASHKNNIVDLLTFRHFLYFLAAPTLCYQLQYPRNSRIRYVWLLKRCVEFVVIGALEIILWVQYYQPALDKVVTMVQTNNYTYLNLLEEYVL